MRAQLYFRRRGEKEYRALGVQELYGLLPTGVDVWIDVDGTRTRARMIGRRESVSSDHRPSALSFYFDAPSPDARRHAEEKPRKGKPRRSGANPRQLSCRYSPLPGICFLSRCWSPSV